MSEMSEFKGTARKFFFEKFQMSESVFRDAARLIFRRRRIKFFDWENLTKEQEAVLLQAFKNLSKDEIEKLVKKDATVSIFDCVLE